MSERPRFCQSLLVPTYFKGLGQVGIGGVAPRPRPATFRHPPLGSRQAFGLVGTVSRPSRSLFVPRRVAPGTVLETRNWEASHG
jgi:hypothetical protein